MAVTGLKIYELALTLIDEVTETGVVTADNVDYYKTKALNFITMMQTEILPHSTVSTVLNSLNDNVIVTDFVALTVLPYGVASQFLLHENPNVASYLNDRFIEMKAKIPTKSKSITDVYTIGGEDIG